MVDVVDGGGGIGGETASATPDHLHAFGSACQRFSNACAGIARSPTIGAGGQLIAGTLVPQGAGGPGLDPLPANLGGLLNTVLHDIVDVMVSAEEQFADAALDLFQCAGDFATADGTVPPGATQIHPDRLHANYLFPPGVEVYLDQQGHAYYRDRSGTVIETSTPAMVGDPVPRSQAQVGQTYHPQG